MLVLAFAGCAAPAPEAGAPEGCAWVELDVSPSMEDARRLDVGVRATNCGSAPLELSDEGCRSSLEAFPRVRIGEDVYVLEAGLAKEREAVDCRPERPRTAPVPPGETVSILGDWRGGILHASGEASRAPPGEHVIEARAFGHAASVRVTLREDGTFAGGGVWDRA